MDEQKLAALFRKLGARNPEAWARSQVQEKIPQLARFLFLRQAWRLVVSPDDLNWISEAQRTDPDRPGGEIGPAVRRLLSGGGCDADLTTVVRVMQWRTLAGFCQLLDDPGDLESEASDVAWRLFQVDENEKPVAVIGGLIESLLETDPTGRETRPK
jgi:hypothetical protein